jgi:hypothetical protein
VQRSVDLTNASDPVLKPSASRECRVSFRDRQGVEHSVSVNAPSRYHAFGLALPALRQFGGGSVERMSVQVLQNGKPLYRQIHVTMEQFDKWLILRSPADKLKEYILMLLGKIPPSRDFKRGMAAR